MTASSTTAPEEHGGRQRLSGAIALAALGVVFGDIGTSPLYTLKACFTTARVDTSPANVFGIISALLWTLILVVCVKYVTFVMKVDYNGEGGIFALIARLQPKPQKGIFAPASILLSIGIVGAAALFGDGIITPAISVLSAIEGLSVVSPAATTWEVPITMVILLALFLIQWRGTEKVGIVFGPVMALWFLMITVSGIHAVLGNPHILWALNPWYAARFITGHGVLGFLVLGATILCVTGAEALYADMSHFGRTSITFAWYFVVFPALICNYLGQGAVVLNDPKALDNAFYALTPGAALMPMIALAAMATVIASQALISGAYTLVEQGIALNVIPRMQVIHTSNRYPGQVYVPAINALLAVGCLALVLIFRTSDALAAAYGLAVALTMAATTVLFYFVTRRVLGWPALGANILSGLLFIMDCSFVLAGIGKVPSGGWLPLVIALVLTVLAGTWYEGRRRVAQAFASYSQPVADFLRELHSEELSPPDSTAVFLTGNPDDIPFMLRRRWLREQIHHQRIVILGIFSASEPYVDEATRVRIEHISDRVTRVIAHFGFMEQLSLRPVIESCVAAGLDLGCDDTSFIVASPQIVAAQGANPFAPRRWLFDIMHRLAGNLTTELQIPSEQLMKIAVDVPL